MSQNDDDWQTKEAALDDLFAIVDAFGDRTERWFSSIVCPFDVDFVLNQLSLEIQKNLYSANRWFVPGRG